MAHSFGRLLSVLLTSAIMLLVGSEAGHAQPGTPKGEWIGLFGCSNTPTYLRMNVGADGAVDLFVHNERIAYQADGIAAQGFEASLPQTNKRRLNRPTAISAHLDPEQDLLTGTLAGWGEPLRNCTHFVLARMQGSVRPDNPDGLLFVPPKALSAEQCRNYANWLLSREAAEVRLPELRFSLSSALNQADAMWEVLGQDIAGWTDDHVERQAALARTCRTLLAKQRDAETKSLVRSVQKTQRTTGGWILAPLGEPRDKRVAAWTTAAIFLHLEDIEPLVKTLAEANAGRFDPPPAPDGSRHLYGYYDCDAGPVFLKLALAADGASGRIEFGSSMLRNHPRGVLDVAPVPLEAEGLRIEPSAWVLQPRFDGRTPLTLEGRLDPSTGTYEGSVLGVEGCTSFALEPEPQPIRAQNFDGLLFQIRSQRDHDLDTVRCRTYAEWLAGQTLLEFGNGRFYSSAVTDAEGMVRVLGKAPEHFRPGDSTMMITLSQACRRLLTESMDANDRTLAASVEDWLPRPFSAHVEDAGADDWLIAEQLALVMKKRQEAVESKLAEVAALPAELSNLEVADRQRAQALRTTEGWLQLLNATDRKHLEQELLAARRDLEIRIAGIMAGNFASVPLTYEGFEQLDKLLQQHQLALQAHQATAGAAALQDAYAAVASKRAGELWPGFLDEAEGTLAANADAGYGSFGRLAHLSEVDGRLSRHANPDAELAPRLSAYRERSRSLALDMVRRSEVGLSAWVAQLPPSAAGREALSDFTRKTFGADAVPEEFGRLRTAVEGQRGRENPLGLSRPDIAQALLDRQWQDVAWQGFDDMAYYQTTLERIKNQCPGIVPQGEGSGVASVLGFFTRMAQLSTARMMSGQADNQEDAERAVFFALNAIFNRPGCVVDQWGNVVGMCTTEEEFSGAQQAIMTSSAAIADVDILLADGCEGRPATLMRNLVDFAALGESVPQGEPIVSPAQFVAASK